MCVCDPLITVLSYCEKKKKKKKKKTSAWMSLGTECYEWLEKPRCLAEPPGSSYPDLAGECRGAASASFAELQL